MAVYNQTVLTPDPLYLQPKSYDARSDRKWYADIVSPGVLASGDFAVTVPGSPSGLTLNYAAGVAWVLGGNIADQGMYRQYVSAGGTIVCPAADATNPRIDTIILRIMDNAADASGFNEPRIEAVPGTPTAGATLANLNGKNPLTALGEASKSFVVLAYALVPNGAAAFTNTATNIKDARSRATLGGGGMLPTGARTTTSLWSGGPPVSPADGDVWIATAVDTGNLATTNGTRWTFQYNASSGSASKWEFIGGSELEIEGNANVVINTLTQVAATGWYYHAASMSYTTTRAGDYTIHGGVQIDQNGGAAGNGALTLFSDVTAPLANTRVDTGMPQSTNATGGMYTGGKINTIAASKVIGLAVAGSVPGTYKLVDSHVFIKPVRIT